MPTEEVMTKQHQNGLEDAAAQESAEMRKIFDVWRQQSGMGAWREEVCYYRFVALAANVTVTSRPTV